MGWRLEAACGKLETKGASLFCKGSNKWHAIASFIYAILWYDIRSGTWTDLHLFAACLYWTTDMDTHYIWDKSNPNWTNLTDAKILKKYSDNGSMYSGGYQDQGSD
jgi:hypothetical protein